jgi:hypothetical protein
VIVNNGKEVEKEKCLGCAKKFTKSEHALQCMVCVWDVDMQVMFRNLRRSRQVYR